MIQLTTAQLINSTSGRVCNFGIFQRRQFLWNHQMTSHFSHYSRTENFLLVVRPNRRRFSFDSKGAPNFQKNVYWEIPKRCLISNSFSLLKLGPNSLCDQGTSIATLLDLTPGAKFNHEKLCSMKNTLHEKLPGLFCRTLRNY